MSFSQLFVAIMLSGLLLLFTPTDLHTAWINSSTLLSSHLATDPRLNNLLLLLDSSLSQLLNLMKLLESNPYTKQVPSIYTIYKTKQGQLSTTQLLQTQVATKYLCYIKWWPIPSCESPIMH